MSWFIHIPKRNAWFKVPFSFSAGNYFPVPYHISPCLQVSVGKYTRPMDCLLSYSGKALFNLLFSGVACFLGKFQVNLEKNEGNPKKSRESAMHGVMLPVPLIVEQP